MAPKARIRDIFQGPPADVAQALLGAASSAKICPEPPQLETRQQKQQRILRMRRIVKALEQVQPNLAFSRLTMIVALRFWAASEPWGTGLHVGWAQEVWDRLRPILRFVAQARIKTPGAAWLKNLDEPHLFEGQQSKTKEEKADEDAAEDPAQESISDGSEEEEEAVEGEQAGEATDARPSTDAARPKPEWLYGFCHEQRQAWRVAIEDGVEVGEKLFTRNFTVEPSCRQGEEEVHGHWPDGHSARLETLSPDMLPTKAAPCKRSIRIKEKKDRHPIFVLEVDGKQKCQIRKQCWDDEGKARAVLQQLADRLEAGTIAEGDLHSERDKLIKEQGGSLPKRPRVVKAEPDSAPAEGDDDEGSTVPASTEEIAARTEGQAAAAAAQAAAGPEALPPFFPELW